MFVIAGPLAQVDFSSKSDSMTLAMCVGLCVYCLSQAEEIGGCWEEEGGEEGSPGREHDLQILQKEEQDVALMQM